MTFFLVALLAALLVTKQTQLLLAGKWAAGVALSSSRLRFLNLLWQIHTITGRPSSFSTTGKYKTRTSNLRRFPFLIQADHESAACDGPHLGRGTGSGCCTIRRAKELALARAYLCILSRRDDGAPRERTTTSRPSIPFFRRWRYRTGAAQRHAQKQLPRTASSPFRSLRRC